MKLRIHLTSSGKTPIAAFVYIDLGRRDILIMNPHFFITFNEERFF